MKRFYDDDSHLFVTDGKRSYASRVYKCGTCATEKIAGTNHDLDGIGTCSDYNCEGSLYRFCDKANELRSLRTVKAKLISWDIDKEYQGDLLEELYSQLKGLGYKPFTNDYSGYCTPLPKGTSNWLKSLGDNHKIDVGYEELKVNGIGNYGIEVDITSMNDIVNAKQFASYGRVLHQWSEQLYPNKNIVRGYAVLSLDGSKFGA